MCQTEITKNFHLSADFIELMRWQWRITANINTIVYDSFSCTKMKNDSNSFLIHQTRVPLAITTQSVK